MKYPKCNFCRNNLEFREFLTNTDQENVRKLDYYFCKKCKIIYNKYNDPIAHVKKENIEWI